MGALGRSVLSVGNFAPRESLPLKLRQQPLSVVHKQLLAVPFNLPNFCLNPLTARAFNAAVYAVHRGTAHLLTDYERFFFPLDSIGNWNRIYGKRGFVQYQCVWPLDREQGRSDGVARSHQPERPRVVSGGAQEVRRAGRNDVVPDAGLYACARLSGDGGTARIPRSARRDGAQARRAGLPGQGCADEAGDFPRDVSAIRAMAGGQGDSRPQRSFFLHPVAPLAGWIRRESPGPGRHVANRPRARAPFRLRGRPSLYRGARRGRGPPRRERYRSALGSAGARRLVRRDGFRIARRADGQRRGAPGRSRRRRPVLRNARR